MRPRIAFRLGVLICVGAGLAPRLPAQQNGSGNNGNVAGISIDAAGVVRPEFVRREPDALARRRRAAYSQENQPQGLWSFSEQRVVSLRGLERELKSAGSFESVSEPVLHLYGLQQIDYVFLDPERGDVLLAGPAEGFAPDATGRMRGVTTGRPPLRLDDLACALRWGAGRGGTIGCSIDPRAENLERLQEWLASNSTPAPRDVALARYSEMARLLGEQDVTIFGVPADSHFAQVLVEADYRMKLIALGKENPGVRGVRSQLSLLSPQGNSIQRWWFEPLYAPIEADEEKLAFHLAGQRVQVLAQDERTDGAGDRSDAPFTRRSTERFAELFTEHYPELAKRSAVFAELQNVFDLAVVAALLNREDAARRLNWSMETLLDPTIVLPAFPVPKTVESLSATTDRSRVVLGLLGGVSLNPMQVVGQPYRTGAGGALSQARESGVASVGEGRGWSDVGQR